MYISSQTGEAINEYLYSTQATAFDSATLADGSVAANSDGNLILQKGTVLAKITSGGDSGKVGPYDTDATDGRQTDTNITGIIDERANVTLGDKEVAFLYMGVVDGDKVWADGVQGSLSTAVKDALRSGYGINILIK